LTWKYSYKNTYITAHEMRGCTAVHSICERDRPGEDEGSSFRTGGGRQADLTAATRTAARQSGSGVMVRVVQARDGVPRRPCRRENVPFTQLRSRTTRVSVAAERFSAVSPGCTVLADATLFEAFMVSAALPRQECGQRSTHQERPARQPGDMARMPGSLPHPGPHGAQQTTIKTLNTPQTRLILTRSMTA
jgi:hypothetical protein